jgi:hypothetical protein
MSSKKPAIGGNDYRVFQDSERHTCIRVNCASKAGVWFIPWDVNSLRLELLPHKDFEQQYVIELKDYPVKKAAASYIGATWVGCSEEVRKHLEYLSGVKFKENAKIINFEGRESVMSEAAQAAVAAAKKSAADEAAKKAKAPAKAPAKKAAAPAKKAEVVKAPAPINGKAGSVKKVEAPAKKVEAAKVPAKKVDATSTGEKGRTSKELGKKITVLNKNPKARAGSNLEKMYGVLITCKTTDEAGEKLRAMTDKPWDVVRMAVKKEIIKVS